ncbi:MAG: hypothetical protein LUE29_06095 [Lachnospiraceae bacterium]|nr:hypothetical protein [Lachnospiraceae bacterium]
MKKLRKAEAMECAISLVCEEDGREETLNILVDVAHMAVTSRTFAPDIREWDSFAEQKLIPELALIPYHALYQDGYGDERFLIGAFDALRFYRGDDVDEMVKKLSPYFPQACSPDPSLKVIDFDVRGNQVILYLGKPELENYSGDGWDETPYEFYAGTVGSAYIEDAVVLNFPADTAVFQACEAQDECPKLGISGNVSKNRLRAKKIPCVLYSRDGENYREIRFDDVIGEVLKAADVPVSKFEHLV